MDIYEFVKNIGNGMYGQVYLTQHKLEKKQYAVKRINFQDINQRDRENLENEVRLLQELRHPNIVSYKDSFCDNENYFNIVMIYCDGGDVYNKIRSSKGKHYGETEIIEWIVQLGLALLYIHDKKILHRDLKTQNIFLKDGKIRIGDFGIAKMFNHTKELANSVDLFNIRWLVPPYICLLSNIIVRNMDLNLIYGHLGVVYMKCVI
jgi:serine/threonine protein kinase